ncbi:MAG: hydroxyquinol 1,2-dioxygenase [Acidisphaera sp.]|nr:hydroxyquinol 1,2-dioxygenase [Acidisphaera sp.]MBV9811241.1 hydroxyquinol 1,2-dioxygenase [Acetobacteraceae bacterium]
MDAALSQEKELSAYGLIDGPDSVTEVVLRAMSGAQDARLRQVMEAFVRHLHAFAREVRLTEDEFERAVDVLNRIGRATHGAHNEGILFADAVGLSTLVCLLNNGGAGPTETAAALLGPFWRDNAPPTQDGGSIVRSPTDGPALAVTGRFTDPQGAPLAAVEVDVWHSSPSGFYENQDATQAEMNLRGRFTTGADGVFRFRSVLPAGYPVPTDGPVGELLRAQRRHPFRPAHLHVMGFKPGYKTLIAQVFVADDPRLESDVVFGVTRELVGNYVRHSDGGYTLDQTFVMQPGEAKRPTPPIS